MTFNRGLFSSASGEWETPQELFDVLNEEFHFTLDACATPENAKCRNHLGGSSGLLRNWGGNVWCNPPYGRSLIDWVAKGWLHTRLGHADVVVMLLPSRTDTRWFHEYVMKKADEIRFIRGRLKFGGAKNSAPFPSCLVVFRAPQCPKTEEEA